MPAECKTFFSGLTLQYYIKQGGHLVRGEVGWQSIAETIEAGKEGNTKQHFKTLFRALYGDAEYEQNFSLLSEETESEDEMD